MEFKYKIKKIGFLYKPYRIIRDIIDNKQLKKRNIAIKKYGYEMLDNVCRNLKESNIQAFCAYGTLLGFMRDKGFISYDLDIDMGVIDDNNFSWDKLDKIIRKSGLDLKHQFILDDGRITERTYYKGDATIDFFLFKKVDGSMVGYIYEQEKYSSKYMVRESVIPLVKKIKYDKKNGIEVPIISNYEEFLVKVYGNDWKIPNPEFKHNEKILSDRFATIERFKK